MNLTLYTTVSLGGYGEALLLGQILLLLTLVLLDRSRRAFLYAAWGFLAGLGFWTFGLMLVYILPSGLALAWRDIRSSDRRGRVACWLATAVGAAVGMGPWIAGAVTGSPGTLLRELFGSAIAARRPAACPWPGSNMRAICSSSAGRSSSVSGRRGTPAGWGCRCSPSCWQSGRACFCTCCSCSAVATRISQGVGSSPAWPSPHLRASS